MDKDVVSFFDEGVVAFLDEGVVACLDNNNKYSFYVDIRHSIDVCFDIFLLE